VNRSDLIATVAERAGLSPQGARSVVEALFGAGGDPGAIAAALAAGERVQLAGFGTFEVRARKERRGRNPQTRAPMVIPGGPAPVFRPGTALRGALRPGGAPV
jgi:DNA-binding protein HU-beta